MNVNYESISVDVSWDSSENVKREYNQIKIDLIDYGVTKNRELKL